MLGKLVSTGIGRCAPDLSHISIYIFLKFSPKKVKMHKEHKLIHTHTHKNQGNKYVVQNELYYREKEQVMFD